MDLPLIISLGVLLGCFLGLSWFAGTDAPFVPTKTSRIKKLLKIFSLKNKNFYELGSGDGRVVIAAAQMGANACGIEQSWIRVFYSRYQAHKLPRHLLPRHLSGVNVNFYHGSIFDRTYQDGDIIYIYLLQKAVNKIESKLKKELKKGSIVITQTFHFKNWKPYKKILITDKAEPNNLLGPNKFEGDFWVYKA